MTGCRIGVVGIMGIVSVALAGGCSKGRSETVVTAAGAASRAAAGNACDRSIVTPADAAEILGAPIVETRPISGDPQSCEFRTAGLSSVTVTLRPGLGSTTVQAWLAGRMPVSATPFQGVGDRAAWVAELSEVVATKADLLCDIQTTGSSASQAALQQKGERCATPSLPHRRRSGRVVDGHGCLGQLRPIA